jgi:hypothetical protein
MCASIHVTHSNTRMTVHSRQPRRRVLDGARSRLRYRTPSAKPGYLPVCPYPPPSLRLPVSSSLWLYLLAHYGTRYYMRETPLTKARLPRTRMSSTARAITACNRAATTATTLRGAARPCRLMPPRRVGGGTGRRQSGVGHKEERGITRTRPCWWQFAPRVGTGTLMWVMKGWMPSQSCRRMSRRPRARPGAACPCPWMQRGGKICRGARAWHTLGQLYLQ